MWIATGNDELCISFDSIEPLVDLRVVLERDEYGEVIRAHVRVHRYLPIKIVGEDGVNILVVDAKSDNSVLMPNVWTSIDGADRTLIAQGS